MKIKVYSAKEVSADLRKNKRRLNKSLSSSWKGAKGGLRKLFK